jgi:hypothetical protein
MPLLKKNAKTGQDGSFLGHYCKSSPILRTPTISVSPHALPTQCSNSGCKRTNPMQGQGSSSTVHQNRLFDDAKPCEARMMHFEATKDDIKGSYQFISIVYLDQVHRIYIVWCGHILPTSKSYFPSLKSLWMNIGWIAYIFSAGDDLPIICGFQSLLDPDSPGGKLLKQFRSWNPQECPAATTTLGLGSASVT